MKYIIERTSAFGEQPIPTAYIEKIHRKDTRVIPNDENEPWFKRFIASCHNIERKDDKIHGIVNEPEEVWVDEIEDLHKFVEQYGRIILNKPACEEGLWSVEIYDDYRE